MHLSLYNDNNDNDDGADDDDYDDDFYLNILKYSFISLAPNIWGINLNFKIYITIFFLLSIIFHSPFLTLSLHSYFLIGLIFSNNLIVIISLFILPSVRLVWICSLSLLLWLSWETDM